MLDKGLVQIYTGCGKGKTTAAFGLALRAAGHGAKVLICQFLKPASLDLGERKAVRPVNSITIEALDEPWDMRESVNEKGAARKMRNAIKQMLASVADRAGKKQYDVIILDEIVFCLDKNLADLADIKTIIEKRDGRVEIIMTGRGAGAELIDLADLVTEMKSIKHPFEKGIGARKGIEF